jgi:hypothetical protein
MLRDEQKQRVLAKLTNARNEIEDALKMSTTTPRYDPVVLADASRNDLSVMVDDLSRMIHQLKGIQ